MPITLYNPSIILVIAAGIMDKKRDRKRVDERLRDFANAGGIVIFGGVPWAFNKSETPGAQTVLIRHSILIGSSTNAGK